MKKKKKNKLMLIGKLKNLIYWTNLFDRKGFYVHEWKKNMPIIYYDKNNKKLIIDNIIFKKNVGFI